MSTFNILTIHYRDSISSKRRAVLNYRKLGEFKINALGIGGMQQHREVFLQIDSIILKYPQLNETTVTTKSVNVIQPQIAIVVWLGREVTVN